MEATYHYYAFISYSTSDSEWAKKLQHQLSYYHIPSAIKKSKSERVKAIPPIGSRQRPATPLLPAGAP